ncbi:MAG: hypothetical protein ACQ9ET_00005, partial [Nitrosomonadaceae bacterium]
TGVAGATGPTGATGAQGPTGVGGNTLYIGDDALTSNRTVNQSTFTLDFTTAIVDAFSVDGSTFSVDASANRVGIGTIAPSHGLHVSGDARITDKLNIGGSSSDKKLNITGNLTQDAWTTTGILMNASGGNTFTDQTSSGTVSAMTVSSFGANAVAASSATIYTIASTLRIDGGPTAGTNVTLSNSYPLFVNSGISRFNDGVTGSGNFQVFDNMRIINGDFPLVSFRNSTNTATVGAFSYNNTTVDRFDFFVGSSGAGDLVMSLQEDGDVGIGSGTANPTGRLHVEGEDATSSNYSIVSQDDVGTNLFRVRNDGFIRFGGFATEQLDFRDGGSAAATEQDWIEVTVGGNIGYIRVYATK